MSKFFKRNIIKKLDSTSQTIEALFINCIFQPPDLAKAVISEYALQR